MSHDQLVCRLQVWDSVSSFLQVSAESFESCLAWVEWGRAGSVGEKTYVFPIHRSLKQG